MKEVQAFIANISFPKTMDEFLYFLEDDFHFNVDDVICEDHLEWTAPRWCKINDILLSSDKIITLNKEKYHVQGTDLKL